MIKVLGFSGGGVKKKKAFWPQLFIFILQDVCRHMDSVFKELLSRQALQDPAKTSQRRVKWEGGRGKEDQGSSKQ